MKTIFLLLGISGMLLCAAAETPAPAKEKPKPAAQTIPAGAKQIEPYLYSYQDANGKKWLYRETPFGLVKMEDKPAATEPVVDKGTPVIVKDQGETVRFEKNTPFGIQTWTKKKTELNDYEKTLMPSSNTKSAEKQ